jgi:peptide/nickel transport system substrate-binding protein
MKRRTFLAASAAAVVAPPLAAPPLATPAIAAPARLLKFIPEGDLPALDPVWTTATNARNHGYMVFDTLYGQDADYVMRPQMVAGHEVENGGLQWTITLRAGLKFHDGEPVRAQDVVPSITRFAVFGFA